ncbi:hypothetical protein CMI47_05890 [Candidatus Pacearchaeota archaeon]|jgi:hypothetical protein|nr:hypothetical protein [Candidatus Pacearchaeota archaeon]|tara:strand:+ start:445 stop:663 length:219 start_codon:yes stop_codon:yes gene_type:complete
MLVNFTKKELIEINVSVSQNLSKFKDTLKDHEKKSLESVFDKTYKIISNDKFIKVLRDSKFRVNCGIKSLNN